MKKIELLENASDKKNKKNEIDTKNLNEDNNINVLSLFVGNVLSTFDGISCGQIALNRANIKYNKYYASEIDKYAIKITQNNFTDTIQVGDVTKLNVHELLSIDLLIGGSPCQSFSSGGKMEGFDGKSGLFWEYVRILNDIRKYNPNVKFFLENVVMKEEWENIITEALGVDPIFINSSVVSAQNRKRLYWTNIPITLPIEDRNITLHDIVEDGVPINEKSQTILSTIYKENVKSMITRNKKGLLVCAGQRGRNIVDGVMKKTIGFKTIQRLEPRFDGKTNCLTTVQKDNLLLNETYYRKFTPLECERLQTIPDNYTNHVSNTQRYKAIGNAWTVDVIVEFFKNL